MRETKHVSVAMNKKENAICEIEKSVCCFIKWYEKKEKKKGHWCAEMK